MKPKRSRKNLMDKQSKITHHITGLTKRYRQWTKSCIIRLRMEYYCNYYYSNHICFDDDENVQEHF